MLIDQTDLDTYDTDTLEHAPQTPAIRAELSKRATEQAARRRCDECWHEGGTHHPICSNLAGGQPCGCCVDGDGERPVSGQMAAVESNDWSESTLMANLRGGVL